MKKGVLFVPALFIPKLIRAQNFFPAFTSPASAITYLVNENFEGNAHTDVPPWSTPGAGGNLQNTTSPLAGSQDLLLNSTSAGTVDSFVSWSSAGNTIYYRSLFRLNIASSGFPAILKLQDVSNNTVVEVLTRPGGALGIIDVNSNEVDTTATLTTGTTYYLWVYYTAGTGSNATLGLAFSTTSTFPSLGANSVQMTNGQSTTPAIQLTCEAQGVGGGLNVQFDNVLVSASDFY